MRISTGFAIATLVVAACGNGDVTTDAALDAALDAAPPDGPPIGAASITVTSSDGPMVGLDVVFTDPAGEVVSIVQTDATGKASEDVVAGSALTVLIEGPGGERLRVTYVDVEPGDDLTWSLSEPAPASVGSLEVNLPGPAPGAVGHEVRLGCANFDVVDPALPVTTSIPATCLGSDQAIDVLALAFHTDGTIAYTFEVDVAVTMGGLTTVTLGAWQTVTEPLDLTLTNAPADLTEVAWELHFPVDGLDFGGPTGATSVSGGTVAIPAYYLAGDLEDRLRYILFMPRGTQADPLGVNVLLASYPDTPSAATHDLSQALLPTLAEVTAGEAGGRLQLDWTAGGDLSGSDGVISLSQWAEGTTPHIWFAVLPADISAPYQLPLLPKTLADWRPSAAAVFDTPSLIFAEADYVADYRGFRRDLADKLIGGVVFNTLPAGGGTLRGIVGGKLPGQ